MLDVLELRPTKLPTTFIDLDGIKLGHTDGKISPIALFHTPTRHAFLVDIHSLQEKALETPSIKKTTLEDLLEFEIKMAGLHDVQLLSLLANDNPDFRMGLEKTVTAHCKMSAEERR